MSGWLPAGARGGSDHPSILHGAPGGSLMMTDPLPQDFIEYRKIHPELFPSDQPEDKQFLFYQGYVAREKTRMRERVERVSQQAAIPQPRGERIHLQFVYGDFATTDFGNCERLIGKTAGNIRYCPTNDSWYIWNGDGYWRKDSLGEIREYAKATILSIHEESKFAPNEDKRSALRKWATQCEKPEHVNAAIKLASSVQDIAITIESFDTDNYLFNMMNGTYDLRSHIFTQHDRENMITRQVAYNYDPTRTCPQFLAFLDRIFKTQPEKTNIIRYLQKAIGYTLTGEVSQQCIFLLYGSGSNGKSTLMETLRMLMGDYGTTIASASLTTQKNEGVRNDVARLPKIRFVVASENAKGTVIDEELIKKLTGGDEVTARFLFQEEFNFYPQLKLWWAFNHPPGLRDLTHSLMRRLKLIPFTETISDEEKVDQKVLLETFRSELPGIFNWAVSGLKLFYEEGLKDPQTVITAVKDFKDEQDILFDWLLDCCYVVARDAVPGTDQMQDVRTQSKVLYENYRRWAMDHNEKIMSPKKLGMELLERGFKREHTKTGAQYIGISLK